MSLFFGGMVGVGIPSALAACATNPSSGVYYYNTHTCDTLIYSADGYTAPDSFGANNNKIGSVLESKAVGGSWRAYLYGGINHTGLLVGLSNASTTQGKSWDLSTLQGVDNETDSICQNRVTGPYSAADCLNN